MDGSAVSLFHCFIVELLIRYKQTHPVIPKESLRTHTSICFYISNIIWFTWKNYLPLALVTLTVNICYSD